MLDNALPTDHKPPFPIETDFLREGLSFPSMAKWALVRSKGRFQRPNDDGDGGGNIMKDEMRWGGITKKKEDYNKIYRIYNWSMVIQIITRIPAMIKTQRKMSGTISYLEAQEWYPRPLVPQLVGGPWTFWEWTWQRWCHFF
jgi:hypothetical protein